MRTAKSLDCLRLKQELQAKLHERWKGMNTKQIQAAIQKALDTSQSALAKWWRQTARLQASQTLG
jgi:hypothetical protein